ncbi:hypothetical protein SDC9_154897 [bioreactor metagenome]|uniref:Uncharacterized protein n=1 Tax=bioreactor metagenome TaxID=1076179 RepID=A0A645F1U3_9ZZZZ
MKRQAGPDGQPRDEEGITRHRSAHFAGGGGGEDGTDHMAARILGGHRRQGRGIDIGRFIVVREAGVFRAHLHLLGGSLNHGDVEALAGIIPLIIKGGVGVIGVIILHIS